MGKEKKRKWCRKCCLSLREGLVGKVVLGAGGRLGSWNTIPSVHGFFFFLERKECLLLCQPGSKCGQVEIFIVKFFK